MSPGLMRDETGGIADEAYVLNPIRRFFYNQRIFFNLPFKRQFHKMVKYTQTIRRQIPNELFECLWPFCGIGT